MPNAITALAQAILELVVREIPPPQIKIASVFSVAQVGVLPDDTPVYKIMVSGITSEPLSCGYSSGFGLEISALDQGLVGMRVEVHQIGAETTIAYSIGGPAA